MNELGLKMPWPVLITISRLCERRGRFCSPSVEEVVNEVNERYGTKYSRRYIEEQIAWLERNGYVRRERGLLADGRVTLVTTGKGERVVMTLIRLSEDQAIVHNDKWEGIVYDPGPKEEDALWMPSGFTLAEAGERSAPEEPSALLNKWDEEFSDPLGLPRLSDAVNAVDDFVSNLIDSGMFAVNWLAESFKLLAPIAQPTLRH
jgi:DNA-binding MarR family transcriptional regulator